MPEGYPGDGFMDEVAHTLAERYSLQHSTLQVEQGTTNHSCALHAGVQLSEW
jgi:cobalt-zinc-cadmium efflux system protein